MNCIRHISIITVFLFVNTAIVCQKNYKHSIETGFSYGRLLAHRPAMENLVKNNAFSIETSLNFNTNGSKLHHKYYNFPSYGITLNFTNSGNNNSIGNVFSAYGFFSLALSKNKNPLCFKLGLGAGWVEKKFDLTSNFQNVAIGSHLNTNIQLKLEKEIAINKKHQIKYAAVLNHLSNGAFQTPNLGLNFFELQVGYLLGINPQKIDTTSKQFKLNKKTFFCFDNSSALKENPTPQLAKFFINESTFQFNIRKGMKSSFILGSDLIYNSSLKELTGRNIQSGVFAGHLMHLNKLIIGVQMGTYIFNRKDASETFYHKIFSEYKIFKNINLRLALKSHWAKADFFSLGIGYEI